MKYLVTQAAFKVYTTAGEHNIDPGLIIRRVVAANAEEAVGIFLKDTEEDFPKWRKITPNVCLLSDIKVIHGN